MRKQHHLEREGPFSGVLGDLMSGIADELRRGTGPVKWCRACGRKHPTRAGCGLVKVAVQAKSGRMTERLTLPQVKP